MPGGTAYFLRSEFIPGEMQVISPVVVYREVFLREADMKILLTAVNAKYIHSNLAVYSLRAYSRKQGIPVTIREFTINQPMEHVIEQIYLQQPDVLCFSCYIWNIRYVEELIEELHKLLPKVPIWVGGPEVSYETETFLKDHPQVTGIMAGEGEKTFAELMTFYGNTEDVDAGAVENMKKIRGLCFLCQDPETGEEIFVDTGAREPLCMDELPFCYGNMDDFANRIIYYESSRGCPFRCSYCLSSVEKCLRFRSLSLVEEELQFFIDHQVPQVKFVDRTFNCNHRHAMAIWTYIRDHDKGVTNFHFEISADLLNKEEIELLQSLRPGLVQLEIGVQSTNEKTITEIHRTMDLARLKDVVSAIAQGGNIHQHLDLIAGLPYEGMESFHRSFCEVYALKPNQLQMGFLKVLKGSYLYEHREEYGLVYRSGPPYEVMESAWLKYSDVIRLKRIEEMVEVYYNSGQFEVTMKLLEAAAEDPFLLYDALGTFYDEKGYLEMSHSRIRRCEILLEFVCSSCFASVCRKEGLTREMLSEALTFDLYYREKIKSRPSFAPEGAIPKEWRRRYEEKGRMRHLESFTYDFPDKSQKTIMELPGRRARYCVLFDYDKRDPLDHQAMITKIEEAELFNASEGEKAHEVL